MNPLACVPLTLVIAAAGYQQVLACRSTAQLDFDSKVVLAPVLGYDEASKIAHHVMGHDLTLKEAALELGFVDEQIYDRVVGPAKMVKAYVARTPS